MTAILLSDIQRQLIFSASPTVNDENVREDISGNLISIMIFFTVEAADIRSLESRTDTQTFETVQQPSFPSENTTQFQRCILSGFILRRFPMK